MTRSSGWEGFRGWEMDAAVVVLRNETSELNNPLLSPLLRLLPITPANSVLTSTRYPLVGYGEGSRRSTTNLVKTDVFWFELEASRARNVGDAFCETEVTDRRLCLIPTSANVPGSVVEVCTSLAVTPDSALVWDAHGLRCVEVWAEMWAFRSGDPLTGDTNVRSRDLSPRGFESSAKVPEIHSAPPKTLVSAPWATRPALSSWTRVVSETWCAGFWYRATVALRLSGTVLRSPGLPIEKEEGSAVSITALTSLNIPNLSNLCATLSNPEIKLGRVWSWLSRSAVWASRNDFRKLCAPSISSDLRLTDREVFFRIYFILLLAWL